jgi:hypothetical protein
MLTLERLRSCAIPAAMLALAACVAPSTAPEAPRARALGVLQLESSTPAAAVPSDSSAEQWTPSLGDRRYFILPPLVVDAPDTVSAGTPFRITVRTVGMDGCWRADSGEVAQLGDTIVIHPYDRHSGAAVCTMALAVNGLEHVFAASFDTPGVGIIRVNGRRLRQLDRTFEMPVTVERQVIVVP